MRVIPKFQSGSSFSSLFTTYTPLALPKAEVSGSSSKESSSKKSSKDSDDSEKGKLTEKDLFNMLKEIDGLPNEMSSIVTNLINTFKVSSLTGLNTDDLATTYLRNLYLLKVASLNKTKLDEAIKTAEKNGAMAEPAITTDGKLIIQNDNGKLESISLTKFMDNQEAYKDKLLSVSNLAYLRSYSPSYVYNQSIFDVINNSVGYEAFQTIIDLAKVQLGTNENTVNGMFEYNKQALEGLKVLQSLPESDLKKIDGSITAEGLYKYKIIDKLQAGQIKALTDYMVALLPDRIKTWAAYKLGTNDTNNATRALVLKYLASGSTSSHTFDVDYKGSMDHVTGESSSSDKNGTTSESTSFLTSIQFGYGGSYEKISFNPGGLGEFSVNGTRYGAIADSNGNSVDNETLSGMLSKTGIASITDRSSISFGDNLINQNTLDKVAIANTGAVYAALPCIKENGKVKPNFDLIKSFESVIDKVNEELGMNASYQERTKLLEKKLRENKDLKELLDMSGHIDTNKVAPFIIMDAYASNQDFLFKSGNRSIDDLDNPLIRATDDKNDLDYFNKVTGGKVKISGWLSDKLYKSNVFIPVTNNNRLTAIIFSGQHLKDSKARLIESETQYPGTPGVPGVQGSSSSKLLIS